MYSTPLDVVITVISNAIFFAAIYWFSPNLLPENWRDHFAGPKPGSDDDEGAQQG